MNSLVEWMYEWSLEVNFDMNLVMQIHICDHSCHYAISEILLPELRKHKDLGVIKSNHFRPGSSRKATAAEGFRALCVIRKSVDYLNEELFRVLNPTF